MLDIPCIIFAGGKSTRMGEDKSLLPFAGFDTLALFQLFRLKKIFKTVYLSCKDKNKFNFEADFIEEPDTIYAPTAGFVALFEKLVGERFFIISVDSPFITKTEIEKIIQADTPNTDASIAKTASGIQPMCGIYHRSIEKKLSLMFKTNNHKLGYLLNSSNTIYVEFEDEKPFLNLNHPHEYQEALGLI